MKMRFVLTILIVAVLTACGASHDHGHEHDNDAHVENHAAVEAESWAVTAWGQHFELFPEVDALVAGETAGAHVHVTLLEGFTAVTEGSVTIVLASADGSEERFSSTATIRPGIFNVEILPTTPGERDLLFEIQAGNVSEIINGGRVRVGTSKSPGGLIDLPHTLPHVDGGEDVNFLKEQQWRTAFDTEWASQGSLQSSVTGSARVEPPSGGEILLTAPVSGVVRAALWPFTGKPTTTGETLMSLIPTASYERSLAELEASERELQALSEAASARVQRLEALLIREAVSRREVEQARAEATGLEARLEAGQAALASAEAGRKGRKGVPGLSIKAPFAGRIAEVLVSPGQYVAAGDTLLRVIVEQPVWIRVALTPEDSAALGEGISGLILDTGASRAPIVASQDEIRLVAIAPEVDARSGTVEALIEIERNVDDLKPGLRATAQILTPGKIEGIVLPDSAVVDDSGVGVVYVQLEGESFSRREVEVLYRQADLLLVDHVLPGERVVILGGGAIRRASLLASGTIEGHVH